MRLNTDHITEALDAVKNRSLSEKCIKKFQAPSNCTGINSIGFFLLDFMQRLGLCKA